MLPSNAYVVRLANPDDSQALASLAAVDSAPPSFGPILVGEIDGAPAAALSLSDDRVIADRFKETAARVNLLHVRVEALRDYDRVPSAGDRVRAAIRPRRVVARLG